MRIKKNYFAIKRKNNKNYYFIASALNNLLLNIIVFVLFAYSNEFRSEINLVINGSNQESNIISNNFYNFYKEPFEVYINGTLVSCYTKCFLGFGINNITIKFNSLLNSCARMFQHMHNVLEIDLSELDCSFVTSMTRMFENCTNLQKINFGNINTSIVETMDYCFHECKLLSSIDLSKFNTSSVTNMSKLFCNCNSIKSIDVSKFNTSKVEDMFDLFAYCYKLISLNLTNFDTSNVKNMQGIFYSCYSIKYLDLSHFDVSKAINLKVIIKHCINLKYLDISNFNISSIASLSNTFYNCTNLTILKLDNLEINEGNKTIFFEHIPLNIKYCSNENNIINYLLEINRTSNNCSDICFKKNIKIVDDNNNCVESCNETDSKYEYGNICYTKCPYGYPSLINNEYICLNELPENFYLDENENIYKECFITCKNCYGKGNKLNHNCIECKPGFIFLNESNYDNNCYKNCNHLYYFDELNEHNCTEGGGCPEKYKLIKEKNKCIKECKNDQFYQYEYNNICYYQCPSETYTLNDFKCYIKNETHKDFLENIINMISYKINITELNNGPDLFFIKDNISYTFTTTSKQNDNFNNNPVTAINLGNCEIELKKHYDIPLNDNLYILKIDIPLDGMKIPKIEYEVYYPIYKNNLTKLNLSICQNIKIDISIPIDIPKEDLDKYNASSGFYNDILTSEKGTDKILSDRQNDFVEKNMTVCEENCDFTDYDVTQKKAICSCYVKVKLPLINDVKIDKNQLYSNFKDIKNIANFKMMKCAYLFLNKKNIFKNSANYILIIILFLSIITIIRFSSYSYGVIKNEINKIYKSKKIKENNQIIKNKKIKNRIGNKKSTKINKINNMQDKSDLETNNRMVKNILINVNKNEKIINDPNELKTKAKKKTIKIKNKNKKEPDLIVDDYNKILKSKKLKKKKNKKIKKSIITDIINNKTKIESDDINSYTDYELNTLDYEDAIKVDDRTFCLYYVSLIKIKHLLFFSFFNIKDNNSRIIKIYLFFFNYVINYTVSAMFYSEAMMHQIYIDSGAFNFIYQLPEIIYSSIITAVLNAVLTTLGLFQDNFIEIKKANKEMIGKKMKDELNHIFYKVILFFVVTYLLLFFFWFYLGCFCAVYRNTQLHLLKEVSISFATSFITPFFVYLIPGIFRIPSLVQGKERACVYKFSKILQII